MTHIPNRNLTKREIDLVFHLMACGAGGLLPIKVLPKARPLATTLWRIGIVDIWHRQSLIARNLEEPFCSLSGLGRDRGAAFAAARQSWSDKAQELEARACEHIPLT